jgi:disulfide bond formation protein DsbB
MPFVPSVSKRGLYERFILLFMLLFILIIVVLGIVEFPLKVQGLLTITGSSFLSVPISIIHGFVSLITDLIQSIYNTIMNLIVKPLQSLGSTIGNGLSSGLGALGL